MIYEKNLKNFTKIKKLSKKIQLLLFKKENNMSDSGRLLGIYIRDILIKTTKEEPITIKEILSTLEEDYEIFVDVTTIQRYINEMKKGMKDYSLCGNRDGYYLLKNQEVLIPKTSLLSNNEVNVIANAISNVNYLSQDEKNNIIYKLADQIQDENFKDILLNKWMPQNQNYSEIAERILNDKPKILDNHPILITMEHGRNHISEPFKFFVYNILPTYNDLLLVGRPEKKSQNHLVAMTNKILSSRIKSYKLLEDETFEKTPIKIRFGSFIGFSFNEREILRKECPTTILLPQEKDIEALDNESKIFHEKTEPIFQEIQRLTREGKEQNKEQIENLQNQINEIAEEYRKTARKLKIEAEKKY